jgi:RNA polymerase sigma-70 factor (ECF subfamily)
MGTIEDNSDSDLRAGIRTRDTASFTLLYDRYGGAAYGLASRILGEPAIAAGVVEEAFLSLWRHLPIDNAAEGSVRAGLLAHVHKLAVEQLRSRRSGVDQPAAVDPDLLPERVMLSARGRGHSPDQQVWTAIRQLPAELQRPLLLAYFDGYTHDQIDRLLDLPSGTARGRLRRGMQMLRSALQPGEMDARR